MRETLYWFFLAVWILASRDAWVARNWIAYTITSLFVALFMVLLRTAIVQGAKRPTTPTRGSHE